MLNVTNVEELYAAVNDPQNAGQTIVLAPIVSPPGRYELSQHSPYFQPGPLASSVELIDPDIMLSRNPRPNGGRLELQLDMSLIGMGTDPAAVVIATKQGDPPSFTGVPGLALTGLIRTGRGRNSIERLTIQGVTNAAACIETDLVGTPITKIRVAHVKASGSARGVDVRNAGPAMAGRRIEAEIEQSDLSGDGLNVIRIANFDGAHGGQIYALMNGNLVQGIGMGCLVTNHNSDSGIVDVRSSGDTFDQKNAGNFGCVIAGAIAFDSPTVTHQTTINSSSTRFVAHGSKFQNCKIDGILALGADMRVVTGSPAPVRVASNNAAVVHLWNCVFSGNQIDIEAFGARSTECKAKNNRLTIELVGENRSVNVTITPSAPDSTNWVTVVR